MLCLKLSRIGKRTQPTFRLLVLEKGKDPWGDYLELLGNYNPKTKKAELKADRIKYWLAKGAQLTNSVNNLLINNKIIEGQKGKSIRISKKRKEKIKAQEKKEAVPVAPKETAPTETVEAAPAEKAE
jgi:small subunit ribosomal protein S16